MIIHSRIQIKDSHYINSWLWLIRAILSLAKTGGNSDIFFLQEKELHFTINAIIKKPHTGFWAIPFNILSYIKFPCKCKKDRYNNDNKKYISSFVKKSVFFSFQSPKSAN